MMLEEKNPNPLNEDLVPHFAFLSSDCVEGLSKRVLFHCTLEISPRSFPGQIENLPKPGIPSQFETEKLVVCILSFRAKLLLFFIQILVFLTCSVLVAVCK